MKTLFSKHRWMQIIFGALFIIAGAALTFIAIRFIEKKDGSPDQWLSIILASACFIFGVVAIMSGLFSLQEKRFSSLFPIGAISIAIGVALCYNRYIIGEYVTVLVGSFILAFAVIEIGEAVAMIFFKRKRFWIAFFFVIGAVLTVLGILAIIFRNDIKNVIYIMLGIAMALFGIFEIISGTKIAFKEKKDHKKDSSKKGEVIKEEPEPVVEDAVVEEKHPEA